MAMTFLQMQDRVIALGGYGTVDRDRIKLFINHTLRDIESRPTRWNWLVETASLATTAGTRSVAAPTNLKYHGRLVSTNADARPPVWQDEQSFEAHHEYSVSTANLSGKPTVYTLYDGAYYFDPVPDAVYTYTLQYWKTTADLSADGDTTTIPDQHEDALIYGALMLAAARDKDPDMMGYWQQMYEGKLRSMRGENVMTQYSRVKKIPMPSHYRGSYDY